MKKLLWIVLTVALFACSSDSDVKPDNNSNTNGSEELEAAQDYYDNTLFDVIENNCTSCHTGYHSAGNSKDYSEFANASSKASSMYSEVNSGEMPKDASKLSATDIEKFKQFKTLVSNIQ